MEQGTRRSEEEQPAAYSARRQYSIGDQQAAEAAGQEDALTGAEPLVPAQEADELRSRWEGIQAGFVDDPRHAVEDANNLVDEVTSRIVETFTRARAALEDQWSRGDDVTTEELRVVLQRYRSFFDSLLRTSKAGT
jgi:hypothetical protein